jgi:Holliday junction resolvasome RuvABC endonuclease subunit
MNHLPQKTMRVLAIDPSSGGFGFVVFEGPERLIDWGVKTARKETNARCVRLIADLLERYTPDAVVIEDLAGKRSRYGRRVKELLGTIARLAAQKEVECSRVSRVTVKELFTSFGSTTKHQIAVTITTQLPELVPWLPKRRKPWMSEDCRMGIFDATALALTFLSFDKDRRRTTC